MKYNVCACVNDTEFNYVVSARADMKTKNLFRKCASVVHSDLARRGVLPRTVAFNYELPNIWLNGAVGAVWFSDPHCNISIIRADGCCIAL